MRLPEDSEEKPPRGSADAHHPGHPTGKLFADIALRATCARLDLRKKKKILI